jgi:hypothetical protein
MDFCFGLEESQVQRMSAALGIPVPIPAHPMRVGQVIQQRFATPVAFAALTAPERKRATDRAAGSPFAPTNLRMFRQTYLGMICLATLPESTNIAPWASGGPPTIVEVLPARLARRLDGSGGYKGRSLDASRNRQVLATAIERTVTISPADRASLIADTEGDALDAVLAGIAALEALDSGFAVPPKHRESSLKEGWIY